MQADTHFDTEASRGDPVACQGGRGSAAHGSGSLGMRFAGGNFIPMVSDVPRGQKMATLCDRLVGLLKKNGAAWRLMQLTRAAGLTFGTAPATVLRALEPALADGRVVRIGWGVYQANDALRDGGPTTPESK